MHRRTGVGDVFLEAVHVRVTVPAAWVSHSLCVQAGSDRTRSIPAVFLNLIINAPNSMPARRLPVDSYPVPSKVPGTLVPYQVWSTLLLYSSALDLAMAFGSAVIILPRRAVTLGRLTVSRKGKKRKEREEWGGLQSDPMAMSAV